MDNGNVIPTSSSITPTIWVCGSYEISQWVGLEAYVGWTKPMDVCRELSTHLQSCGDQHDSGHEYEYLAKQL